MPRRGRIRRDGRRIWELVCHRQRSHTGHVSDRTRANQIDSYSDMLDRIMDASCCFLRPLELSYEVQRYCVAAYAASYGGCDTSFAPLLAGSQPMTCYSGMEFRNCSRTDLRDCKVISRLSKKHHCSGYSKFFNLEFSINRLSSFASKISVV